MSILQDVPPGGAWASVLDIRRKFWRNGVACIAAAAFLFSVGTLCVKILASENLPVFIVAFVPSLLCWTVTSWLVQRNNIPLWGETRSTRTLILLRGILGAASLSLYYFSVQLLPMKDAVTLFFCSPVIAAILEWAITGINLSYSALAGCLFTVVGVFLVTQPDCVEHMTGGMPGHVPGMVMAVAAATCNASAFVAVRMLRGSISTLTITWWYHACVVLVTSIPLMAGYPTPAVVPTKQEVVILLVVFGCQMLGQNLLNRGFQLLTATRGSAINVLQVVYAYLWELTFLKEEINLVSVFGGLSVMAGVVTVSMGSTDEDRSSAPSTPEHSKDGYQRVGSQQDSDVSVSGSAPSTTGTWVPQLSAVLDGSWWSGKAGAGEGSREEVWVRGGDSDVAIAAVASGTRMRPTHSVGGQNTLSGAAVTVVAHVHEPAGSSAAHHKDSSSHTHQQHALPPLPPSVRTSLEVVRAGGVLTLVPQPHKHIS